MIFNYLLKEYSDLVRAKENFSLAKEHGKCGLMVKIIPMMMSPETYNLTVSNLLPWFKQPFLDNTLEYSLETQTLNLLYCIIRLTALQLCHISQQVELSKFTSSRKVTQGKSLCGIRDFLDLHLFPLSGLLDGKRALRDIKLKKMWKL